MEKLEELDREKKVWVALLSLLLGSGKAVKNGSVDGK